MSEKNKYLLPFIVVTTLFFMWGFITVLVDALVPRLRDVFELSYFQSGIVQFAFFTAYAVFSIPGGNLISKIGYKKGAVVGLITMGIACLLFYPAASFRLFPIFLLAMFVLAGGITILQVAANPYIAALGPEKTASSRLNLAQAFNSMGATIAPLVSAAFILSNSVLTSTQIEALSEPDKLSYYVSEASAVQGPFIVLAVVLIILALAFASFKLPEIIRPTDESHGSYKIALKTKHLMFGALGIFVYVGAEVSIGSYLINYFQDLDIETLVAGSLFMSGLASTLSSIFSNESINDMTAAQLAGTFVFLYWFFAMVGRFIGSGILQKISAGTLLSIYGVVNVSLLVISMLTVGYISMWSILLVGLFNSIMFPTIFTLAINNLKEHTAQGSGILCTAIVGGAFIPPLYGKIADLAGLQLALIFIALCYAYIAWYGKIGSKVGNPSYE
ncbi:MAG: L-fucose:H+ symporter permease [Balneolaceae bacterium]